MGVKKLYFSSILKTFIEKTEQALSPPNKFGFSVVSSSGLLGVTVKAERLHSWVGDQYQRLAAEAVCYDSNFSELIGRVTRNLALSLPKKSR